MDSENPGGIFFSKPFPRWGSMTGPMTSIDPHRVDKLPAKELNRVTRLMNPAW